MLALAFSGGKDSLACWYLYREQRPAVVWVNAGKAYPETVALVDEIKSETDNFIEVKSDQDLQNAAFGIPSDIVPVEWTMEGMTFTSPKPTMVQAYLRCCADNIWMPLYAAIKRHGITHLVRGQRLDESHKSTARNGTVSDGITYIHPIENWTKKQVLDFILAKRGSIPSHYHIEHSSLDCYDCTAYAAHSADRIAWTEEAHPDLYSKYLARMTALKSALAETANLYR